MEELILYGRKIPNGFKYSKILNPKGDFFILIGEGEKIFNSFTLRNGEKASNYIALIDDDFKKRYNLEAKNDK